MNKPAPILLNLAIVSVSQAAELTAGAIAVTNTDQSGPTVRVVTISLHTSR